MRAFLLIASGWLIVVLLSATWVSAAEPWEVNQPICTVQKELYQPNPRPDVTLFCWTYYVGPELQRIEHYIEESLAGGDDVHINPRQRFSNDNGRTWTPFEERPAIAHQVDGAKVQTGRLERPFYDPVANVVVRFHDQYVYDGKGYHHTFYDLSDDYARTYGTPKLVTYEEGGSYNPNNILNPDYLSHNYAYPGNNTIRHSNGTLVHVLTETMVPNDDRDRTKGRRPHGSLCVIGTWQPEKKDYEWKAGKPVWVPLSVSPRGLMEAQVAELKVFDLDAKESDRNRVVVEVEPVDFTLGQPARFSVSLNTHSVALDFDIQKIAVLADDKGNTFAPTAWDGSPAGGHHRSGTLTFPALGSDTQSIKLTLKGIAQVPEWVFEWSLR